MAATTKKSTKKAAAPKKAAARPVSKQQQARLGDLHANLTRALAALEVELSRLVSDSVEAAQTDFSEEGGDPDVASVERDRLRAQIVQTREHLDNVDAAIAAVDDGTYGICRVCAAVIPDERLEVLPDTRLCVGCKAAGH